MEISRVTRGLEKRRSSSFYFFLVVFTSVVSEMKWVIVALICFASIAYSCDNNCEMTLHYPYDSDSCTGMFEVRRKTKSVHCKCGSFLNLFENLLDTLK